MRLIDVIVNGIRCRWLITASTHNIAAVEASAQPSVIFDNIPIPLDWSHRLTAAVTQLPRSQVHSEDPKDQKKEKHESHHIGELDNGSEESVH